MRKSQTQSAQTHTQTHTQESRRAYRLVVAVAMLLALYNYANTLLSSRRNSTTANTRHRTWKDLWRPAYHVTAPKNWINDPNGPFYNPATNTYHLFYQHNPFAVFWDHMVWGHLQSTDLIHWVDKPFALEPGPHPYDDAHIFSGSAILNGYNNLPTLVYTGIPKHPNSGLNANNNVLARFYDQWKQSTSLSALVSSLFWSFYYRYEKGSETQALAFSKDGGNTWIKLDKNPLIPSAPPELSITGFRDPFIFNTDTLNQALIASGHPRLSSNTTSHQYMIIAGGIAGKTGTVFIYASKDWLNWDPLSLTLFPSYPISSSQSASFSPNHHEDEGIQKRWGKKALPKTHRALDTNFEVPNLWVLDVHVNGVRINEKGVCMILCSRGSAWFLGHVSANVTHDKQQVESISFESSIDDLIDFGNYYAPTGMYDPKNDRVITWGWIQEDDGPQSTQRIERGWAGMHSIPREIYIQAHDNVAFDTDHPLVGQWMHSINEDGKSRVKTFGQRPIPELNALRVGKEETFVIPPTLFVDGKNEGGGKSDGDSMDLHDGLTTINVDHRESVLKLLDFRGDAYQVEAIVDFSNVKSVNMFGLSVRQSKALKNESVGLGNEEKTLVYYHHQRNQVVVDRSQSSNHPGFGKNAHVAPLGLLKTNDGVLEKLHLRVFVDRGVVEVYANERAVISSRIYPQREDSVQLGVFVDEGILQLESLKVWKMGSSFPLRH